MEGAEETPATTAETPALSAEEAAAAPATQPPPASAQTKPVAVLRGDEIAPQNVDLKTLREKAKAWYDENLIGIKKSVTNPQLGQINFTSRGRGKAISSSANPLKLRIFPSLPDILENGTLIGSEANKFPEEYPNIVRYHWIEAPVEVDGVMHRVRVNVEEQKNRKLYYNHTLPDQYKPPTQGGSPGPGPSLAKGALGISAAPALFGNSKSSADDMRGEGDNLNLQIETDPEQPTAGAVGP